jgi:hypothetical protein
MAVRAEKHQQRNSTLTLTVQTVMLERLRLTYPSGLSVSDALRAGTLLGGAQLVLADGLRMLALDKLEELGISIDRERVVARRAERGALPSGLYIARRSVAPPAI